MSDNKAAQAEAFDEKTVFEFDGKSYSIDPSSNWSLDALEAFEAEKMITFLRELLGDKQWAAFKETRRTAADVSKLVDALMEAAGTPNS